VALLSGLVVALLNLSDAKSTVNLITFAQALTVLGTSSSGCGFTLPRNAT
jgi:hypothetical protein